MAQGNKTVATGEAVEDMLSRIEPPERQADARVLAALMARLSGEPATMWEPAIVGFGRYHYRYDSGREGDSLRIGFASRKAELVIYLAGLDDADLTALGKHRHGKGCLYVKRLRDIDMAALETLIAKSLAHMDEAYPR